TRFSRDWSSDVCSSDLEELWSRLGHPDSLATEPFPEADPALLVDETVEIPVQVNGKVRTRIQVPAGADADSLEAAARADDKVAADRKSVVEGKSGCVE